MTKEAPVAEGRIHEFVTKSGADTIEVGRKLARLLAPPQLLVLRGDLGTGKTTLVKGIAQALDAAEPDEVTSPTFTLLHEYDGALDGKPVKLFHLDVYRIEGEGKATRYGANVGRDGFRWSGEAYVGRKAEWATWTPPKEMIQRQPEAAKYAGGMPGGLNNPLGARTLYLYQNGVYTLYTIYSTSVPQSIGTGITSGCTGLLSQDMIDLYSRTPVKTKVVVLPA